MAWRHRGRCAIYANRRGIRGIRGIRGERGKQLLRQRGELIERSFAHCYETGGMRRLFLRGRANLAKRLLIHAAGFNPGLLMRTFYGLCKPRSASRRAPRGRCVALGVLMWILMASARFLTRFQRLTDATRSIPSLPRPRHILQAA